MAAMGRSRPAWASSGPDFAKLASCALLPLVTTADLPPETSLSLM